MAVTLIVPYWVMQAFTRNNLNHIELLNYGSLRKVLSIDDVAQYYSVNMAEDNTCPVLGCLSSGNYGASEAIAQTNTPEEKNELINAILPLARAATTLEEVQARLMGDVPDGPVAESTEYHTTVQVHGGATIFIIKRGFLEAVKNRDYALKVISDYLKAQYSQLPIDKVSNLKAYSYYLKLLSESVR